MRFVLPLLALALAACSTTAEPGPTVTNRLETSICVVQVSPCDGSGPIDVVSPSDPLEPGASVSLPDSTCQDMLVEPCDGEFIEVIAIDSDSDRLAGQLRI